MRVLLHTYVNFCTSAEFIPHHIFIMKHHDKDYIDYSHRDAPDILDQVLTYFFLDEHNITTYALPKKHYDAVKQGDAYANA